MKNHKLPLVKTRKPHRCRLCGERIDVGESVHSWSSIEPGEGWMRGYAHPECYAETEDWDDDDWESAEPGDMERPKQINS